MNTVWTSAITALATAAIVGITLSLLNRLKFKAQSLANPENSGVICTYVPNFYKTFFIVLLVFFLSVTIIGDICIAVLKAPSFVAAIITPIGMLMFLLCLIGYLIAKYNYEVTDSETITVFRLFFKPRVVPLSAICSYKYIDSVFGGMWGYDKNGIVLFHSAGECLNQYKLALLFDGRGIPRFSTDIGNATKSTPVYKRSTKKRTLKLYAWISFSIGLLFIGLFGLVAGLAPLTKHEFKNYEVSGVISTYEKKNKFITITLENDIETYCINNIVYDALDPGFDGADKIGRRVNLLIGYVDSRNRLDISQLEMNGIFYLRAENAEKAVLDNYNFGMDIAWVFLGVGVVLLVIFVPCLVCSIKIKVNAE